MTIPAEMLRALNLEQGGEVQIELKPNGTEVLSKPADPFAEMIREARRQHSIEAYENDQRVMRESREPDR